MNHNLSQNEKKNFIYYVYNKEGQFAALKDKISKI